MSPLWHDEIGAYLSPRRLCLVRLGRGWEPRVVAEHERIIEPAEASTWDPCIAALGALITQPAWQRARMRVVVSNHWARFAVVPWDAAVSSSEERLAHARQLLASFYGEVVSAWEVRLSDSPPFSASVACTVPTELTTVVRALCSQHAIRLTSLQPQLIAAYEAWRHRLPETGAWFVTIEQGSLAAVRIGAHGWDRVHTVRIGSDWTRELKRLQTFGRIAGANPADGEVYVDAPRAWRELAGEAVRDLQWLDEETGPLNTLQRLGRVRRMAA